ncbi:MAG TPA: hypothetical protein VLF20_03835 [Patescibacteria group bacterium]|nr:hypothetical protein [Patescibacteria group bacterium]
MGRRLHERYYDVSNTPLRGIAENPPKLIGYGGENFVFLHTPQDTAPFVLKIDKRSLRLVPEEINERARAIKSRHQQIREWYQDIPNFVVPTHFFVARLPFRNAVAVGSIQEYFPEARDLFTEFTESELVEIFIQDRKLQTNFSTFVDRFFTILANSGQSIDLVGHQNVCLIKGEEGRYELRLLDTADIKERDEEQEKFRFTIREARRNKLKRLIEKIAIIPDSFEELPRGQ